MKKTIIGLFILVSTLLYQPEVLVADDNVPVTSRSVEGQIAYFSELYGGDAKIISKVMECESGGDHSVKGDGGRSTGIFQFQKETFNRISKAFGEKLDYNSKFDQIKLGTWALSNPDYAKEWTTYVAIQKGGKYSFYSRQMKRHYTVYCKV